MMSSLFVWTGKLKDPDIVGLLKIKFVFLQYCNILVYSLPVYMEI